MNHPLLLAFGLPHGSDWLYICVAAVLFFGSTKIPQLARGLGKSLAEYKKGRSETDAESHHPEV
jgi:TatA/E family protein of Tat protein translocase